MNYRALYIADEELQRAPAELIAQLSQEARRRAAFLHRLPYTDDMLQMLDDLTRGTVGQSVAEEK